MDEIVKAAISKWPNVPHCFGWLALDARGNWRMRDERAQTLNLPGDKIRNAALLGFINRNYQHDEQGRWYFQNGPQRVYVDLATTPYIAHTSPTEGFILQTGATLAGIEAIFLSVEGQLFLRAGPILAQLDDRDLAGCLRNVQLNGKPVTDEELMAWLDKNEQTPPIHIELSLSQKQPLPIQHGELNALMALFAYEATPRQV